MAIFYFVKFASTKFMVINTEKTFFEIKEFVLDVFLKLPFMFILLNIKHIIFENKKNVLPYRIRDLYLITSHKTNSRYTTAKKSMFP